LLQALLGANVDGSGSSFHTDGRKSRDQPENDDLPMVKVERDEWRSARQRRKAGGGDGAG
jgi:hypothetical protein